MLQEHVLHRLDQNDLGVMLVMVIALDNGAKWFDDIIPVETLQRTSLRGLVRTAVCCRFKNRKYS